MRLLPLLATVVAPLAVLMACQSGATSPLETSAPGSPLSVVPRSVTVNGGTFIQLTARIRHDDGSYSQPDNVAWSSSNIAIASVDRNGRVLALKSGLAQIVATWQDSRGSSVVTVLEQVQKKPSGCLAAASSEASIPIQDACQ